MTKPLKRERLLTHRHDRGFEFIERDAFGTLYWRAGTVDVELVEIDGEAHIKKSTVESCFPVDLAFVQDKFTEHGRTFHV